MKRVFVSCRLRPSGLMSPPIGPKLEILYNQELAKLYARKIVSEGNHPIVPILLYPDFLNPQDKEEDELGIKFCESDMRTCDEFAFFVDDRGWSDGMIAESNFVASTPDWRNNSRVIQTTELEKTYAMGRAQDKFMKGCHV
jgi:hypothetical protein